MSRAPSTPSAARRLHSLVSPLIGYRIGPSASPSGEFVTHLGPIVQRCRIEVGPVRPHQGACLGIELHLVERREVLKRPEQHTSKNRCEINTLLGAVGERHTQRVRRPDMKSRYPVDWMGHRLT